MKTLSPEIVLSKGNYTIIEKNGLFGLRQDYDSYVILECKYPDIKWMGDIICIFNGSKWACLHLRDLDRISNQIRWKLKLY